MRSVTTNKPAHEQDVDWLTPAPDGSTVELAWPDADGPFLLTCHLAAVDGRTILVGLDVRSFRETSSGIEQGPQGILEVNHPALRSLRAGEIAEAARAKLAAELAAQARSRKLTPTQRAEAQRRFGELTSPSRPRPTGHRPASPQLEKVAQLYAQALASGGESARKPSLFVHHALAAEGSDITLNAVRGQIHRARQKGLIPAAGDRS